MGRKQLMPLLVAASAMVTLPALAQKPTFEVASVKYLGEGRPLRPTSPPTRTAPNVFYRAGETVASLVQLAYGLQSYQVVGGPDWVRVSRFEINAKTAVRVSPEQTLLMLQSLLEQRFKLIVRKDQQVMRFQALVASRKDGGLGPKLEKCNDPQIPPARTPVRIPRGAYLLGRSCSPISDS